MQLFVDAPMINSLVEKLYEYFNDSKFIYQTNSILYIKDPSSKKIDMSDFSLSTDEATHSISISYRKKLTAYVYDP